MLNSYELISKTFDELTKIELYAILALRIQVFCVEQNCPYQDIDNQDQDATHVFIKEGNNMTAYARIIKETDNIFHIGRVVVKQSQRKYGLATKVMAHCIETINQHEKVTIFISAQSYLKDFYKKLGFKNTGKYYLEDDIPHEQMQITV